MESVSRRFRRCRMRQALVRIDHDGALLHDVYGSVQVSARFPDPGGDPLFGYSLLRNGCVRRSGPAVVLPYAGRFDRTTANGWRLSAQVVAAGRRDLSEEPEPSNTFNDPPADLAGEPPGSLVVMSPAAPHGPPAPRVGVAA